MSQLTYKQDPTDRSFVYLHNHAASTFTYTSRDTTAPSSIFQLKFTKVSAGALLAMFDDGFLSDADSNSASKDGASGKKLLLTFKTDAKQSEMEAGYTGKLDPVIGPAFVFSWQ